MIPVFVLSYNQVTLPDTLVKQVQGFREAFPIVVDNHSTDPETIQWLSTIEASGVMVYRLPQNFGQQVLWKEGLSMLETHAKASDYYVVTDGDLDLSEVPSDVLLYMRQGFKYDSYIDTVGLGLRLDDLTEAQRNNVPNYRQMRSYYLRYTEDKKFRYGSVDTTFSMRKLSLLGKNGLPAAPSFRTLLTTDPYTARHVPWYYTADNPPPEDFIRYIKVASNKIATCKRTGYLKALVSES